MWQPFHNLSDTLPCPRLPSVLTLCWEFSTLTTLIHKDLLTNIHNHHHIITAFPPSLAMISQAQRHFYRLGRLLLERDSAEKSWDGGRFGEEE